MKTKTKKKASNKIFKLEEYFESLDLYDWWEKFSLTFQENGQHKYITVHSFIKSRTSDKRKAAFLWWVLGPKADTPRYPEFAKFQQFDWEHKREKGFWLDNGKIKEIKQAATSRMSSLDEVKATGAFNLDDMGNVKKLLDQLDSEFGGRLQLPNLSAKENDLRLNNYLSLRGKLQGMLHSAQEMFAKTRNLDMSQLAEMMAIVGPSMIGQMSNESKVSPEEQKKIDTFSELTMMLTRKSAMAGIPMPDADMDKIVKKASSPMVIDRKNKVN